MKPPQEPLPPSFAAIAQVATLAKRLSDQGLPEAEIKRRLEQELILAKRQDKLDTWLSDEHRTHAHSLSRDDEDEENYL